MSSSIIAVVVFREHWNRNCESLEPESLGLRASKPLNPKPYTLNQVDGSDKKFSAV